MSWVSRGRLAAPRDAASRIGGCDAAGRVGPAVERSAALVGSGAGCAGGRGVVRRSRSVAVSPEPAAGSAVLGVRRSGAVAGGGATTSVGWGRVVRVPGCRLAVLGDAGSSVGGRGAAGRGRSAVERPGSAALRRSPGREGSGAAATGVCGGGVVARWTPGRMSAAPADAVSRAAGCGVAARAPLVVVLRARDAAVAGAVGCPAGPAAVAAGLRLDQGVGRGARPGVGAAASTSRSAAGSAVTLAGRASAAAMAAFSSATVSVASAITRSRRATMARISASSRGDGRLIALSCSP